MNKLDKILNIKLSTYLPKKSQTIKKKEQKQKTIEFENLLEKEIKKLKK